MSFSRVEATVSRVTSLRSWSVTARRLFVMMFPVSVPVWVGIVAMLLAVMAIRASWAPLAEFWNAPPRRRYKTYQYDLDRHRELRREKRRSTQAVRRVDVSAANAA